MKKGRLVEGEGQSCIYQLSRANIQDNCHFQDNHHRQQVLDILLFLPLSAQNKAAIHFANSSLSPSEVSGGPSLSRKIPHFHQCFLMISWGGQASPTQIDVNVLMSETNEGQVVAGKPQDDASFLFGYGFLSAAPGGSRNGAVGYGLRDRL